jgi:hypothetical protein
LGYSAALLGPDQLSDLALLPCYDSLALPWKAYLISVAQEDKHELRQKRLAHCWS